MLSAHSKNSIITAWDTKQDDGPFRCPGCKQEVILKKGYINVHHFAHKPGEECPYSEYHQGESSLHLRAKKEIHDTLSNHPDVSRLQLERYMGPVRPDISFFIGNTPVAIEMQVSPIPPDTIARRTREYTRRGIALLWIFPYEEANIQDGKGCSIRLWERYIHNIYQGTLYYWVSGEMLCPVHFEDYINKESSHLTSSGMQIASLQSPVSITHLTSAFFCLSFADDPIQRAVKFWCKPDVWIQKDKIYLNVIDAQDRYPFQFPDPQTMIKPPGEIPFSGDPFHEDVFPEEVEKIAPPGRCPRHNRTYKYTDVFGEFYCSDTECWARLRLSQAGAEHNYPQLSGIIDPRDYLPDLSTEPYYLPSPTKDARLIPVYPARPPLQAIFIEEGKDSWHKYITHQHYQKIDQALIALNSSIITNKQHKAQK